MGIFSSIKDFIFGKHAEQTAAPQPHAAPSSVNPTSVAPAAAPATASIVMDRPGAPTPVGQVDVAQILDRHAEASGQQLNWRMSIVDLMKLCGLDSSLSHRQELARELGYAGDSNDTATMNVWLHSAVMRKLAENGGTVPAELK